MEDLSFVMAWGLSRPSTSRRPCKIKDVDARHKAGHDGRGRASHSDKRGHDDLPAHAPLRLVNHLLTISTIYFMMFIAFFSAFQLCGGTMTCSRQRNAISSIAAVLSLVAAGETEVRAEWFSINNAISQAALTNPAVDEASANRRATEAELRQTQGTCCPRCGWNRGWVPKNSTNRSSGRQSATKSG